MLWKAFNVKQHGSAHRLTNRFHVAVHLFSNRSQMTSKCGKNKKVAHGAQPSVSLMFLPHFDVLCDLLLNRRTATWNLFVLYNKELKYTEKRPFYFKFRHFDRHENSTQRNMFFFLPPVYRNCPRPRQGFFLNLRSPSQLNFQNFPPFLKTEGKSLNDDVIYASVLQ